MGPVARAPADRKAGTNAPHLKHKAGGVQAGAGCDGMRHAPLGKHSQHVSCAWERSNLRGKSLGRRDSVLLVPFEAQGRTGTNVGGRWRRWAAAFSPGKPTKGGKLE